MSINPNNGSTETTGSTANLDFNFSQSGDDVILDLLINNTTDGNAGLGATESTLVGLALDLLIGDVTSFSYNAGSSGLSNTFNDVTLNELAQFGADTQYDFGFRSGNGNSFTGGNPKAGLTAGQLTTVSFLLSGNSALSASSVESSFSSNISAMARFQQVNAGGGSDKVVGGVVVSEGAPEPLTMLGSVLGGIGLVAARRRKNQA
jgi:hypothetical protein